jgi:hypothetical protein
MYLFFVLHILCELNSPPATTRAESQAMGVLGGLRPPNTPYFLPHPGDSRRTFFLLFD